MLSVLFALGKWFPERAKTTFTREKPGELKAYGKNSSERAESANKGRIPVNSNLTGNASLKGRNLRTPGESL